jgi:hypothetical protein
MVKEQIFHNLGLMVEETVVIIQKGGVSLLNHVKFCHTALDAFDKIVDFPFIKYASKIMQNLKSIHNWFAKLKD